MLASLLLTTQLTLFKSAELRLVPPEPLPLGGYTARQGAIFEQGGEDLKVRVNTFESNGKTTILVIVEMLTIPESLVEKVKTLIPAESQLMMVATHTHCAPDSQMLNNRMTFQIPGIATYNRTWEKWYAEQIALAINQSLANPAETIQSVNIQEATVQNNRGRREGAKPDPTLGKITFLDRKIFHFAAHATFYEENRLKLSGDWPGAVMAPGKTLILPGAIGDVSPQAKGDTPESKIKNLVSDFQNAKFSKAIPSVAEVSFNTSTINLPKPTPHPDFAKQNGINDAIAGLLVQRFAPQKAELTGILLGQTLIIGVPGEPTSELGKKMQETAAKEGFNLCWVVSHCNGWLGYILMPDDYAQGGYEATLALHGKNFAENILEATQVLCQKFKGQLKKN